MRKGMYVGEAVVLSALLCGMVRPTWSSSVTTDELSEDGRRVAAKFQSRVDVRPSAGYLLVSIMSGSIERNQIKDRQLRIADKVFARGPTRAQRRHSREGCHGPGSPAHAEQVVDVLVAVHAEEAAANSMVVE